jgi:hypothetical protein
MNLDCETLSQAETSLAAILRATRSELRHRINRIQQTDFKINTDTHNDRLLPMLRAVAGRKVTDMDEGRTCWFHATRASDLTSFRDGIWPLPQNFDRIWEWLHTLVPDCLTADGWEKFRRETEEGNYGGHMPDVIRCWKANLGPYAFLYGASALNPRDTSNYDYFGASELVDFIAPCFERKFKVSLLERYRAATRPALIKFTTSGIKAVDLGAAVDCVLHQSKGWSLCNVDPCFSADGQAINSSQMVKAIPVVAGATRFGKHTTYSLSPMSEHISLRSEL